MIYHIYSSWPGAKPEDSIRKKICQESWKKAFGNVVKSECFEPKRVFTGDGREVPYLRDMLEYGMHKCHKTDDYLIWSNDDVLFKSCDILEYLTRTVDIYGFGHQFRTPLENIDEWDEVMTQNKRIKALDAGRDLFIFSLLALRRILFLLPDFVIGANSWDWYLVLALHRAYDYPVDPEMATRVRCRTGLTLKDSWVKEHALMGQYPREIVYHINHKTLSKASPAANAHNLQCAKEGILAMGITI